MAGSFRKLRVPRATFIRRIPGEDVSPAMPISTGITSAPATAAIRQTQEVPSPMCSATMAVTSCPVWVTPSSTIPLSAHMTTMALLPMVILGVP